MFIWEYGNDGKFSFIVCHETGGIASTFCRGVAMGRIKIPLLISNVSACNTTLYSGQQNCILERCRLGGSGLDG